MKKVYGEITFVVSMNCSKEEANERINELMVGNRELILVDDYGNEIGRLEIHNVDVEWEDEDED